MRKTLFLCNTVYQLIVLIELKLSRYYETDVDIIITDTLVDSVKIAEKVGELDLFHNVYPLKIKIDNIEYSRIPVRFREKKIKRYLEKQKCYIMYEEYDEYLFSNVAGIGCVLGEYLKIINRNLELCMFEDGIGSYSEEIYNNFLKRFRNKNMIKRLYFKIFPHAMNMISRYYLSMPEIFQWKIPNGADVIKILPPDNKELLRKILNHIFEYDGQNKEYEDKVIIMEESYHYEKTDVDDMKLFVYIANLIGKTNLIVKRHPREKEDRFTELGIKINKDKKMPWEVILLNCNLENVFLITITSTIAFTSMLLDDRICSRTVLLYKLIDSRSERFEGLKGAMEQLVENSNQSFWIPETMEQLKNILIKFSDEHKYNV